jgi:hypothetical protein
MAETLRNEIRRVFAEWQAGRMTCQAVQHWARDTSTRGADDYSATVVRHLRGLGEYLITVDDIPAYLEGFALPPENAVKKLDSSSNVIDVKARATDLKDDPFYGPHTKAILRELT